MRTALIYNAMVSCYKYDEHREIDSACCQPCDYDGHGQRGVRCKYGDDDSAVDEVADLDFETKVLRELVGWVRGRIDGWPCKCHIFNGAPCAKCSILRRIDGDMSAIQELDDGV